jgi:nicotinamidase-related amidase
MIDLTNAVLLPIDMQQAFDSKPWPQRWNTQVDANALAVLKAWRKAQRPVVNVRHDSVEPGSTLERGQAGHQFRPGFEPVGKEHLVSKSVNSAFIGTDLDLHLRRMGAQTIIAFGITTDMCVSTTIRTGANMGWSFILVEDACDCFDLPGADGKVISAKVLHDAHVATLGFEFCKVVSTQQMIAALQS